MNRFEFSSYLNANVDLEPSCMQELVKTCPTKKIKKGEFLLQAGEISKYTYFVEKGLLRQYSIDSKGKEHILQFAPEGWFVSDRGSVFFHQSSVYFIQALEDTEVALLEENILNKLAHKQPSFIEFNNRLLHNHIRHLQNRITQLLGASAETRYLEFIKLYPDILLRVPQTMVASYLGITPESLSRVRKEMAQNHR